MSWWKFWQKPEPVVPIVEKKYLPSPEPFINVSDYPKSKYSVYWETILNFADTGMAGEVRFMSRDGKVVETHQVFAPTATEVEKLAAKLISEKMENFKVL